MHTLQHKNKPEQQNPPDGVHDGLEQSDRVNQQTGTAAAAVFGPLYQERTNCTGTFGTPLQKYENLSPRTARTQDDDLGTTTTTTKHLRVFRGADASSVAGRDRGEGADVGGRDPGLERLVRHERQV